MRVLVHGGAGTAPDEPEKRRAELSRAVTVGEEVETPRAAVLAAVRHGTQRRGDGDDPELTAGASAGLQWAKALPATPERRV